MDVAKENNLTTSSVLWPVMGRNPNIDYNVGKYGLQIEKMTQEENFEKS